MPVTKKRNALGRGLDSLISMDDVQTGGSSAINEIAISQISPNPDQPRTSFDETALEELAVSIRELGIIQPLTLRSMGPNAYQIISGERRYRAAKLAGLESVPAYVRTVNDAELTEMALIENIQREDLNAIEIALTFRKLIDQYNLTQERLSERIGKNRATIANFLRLLKLPAEVQLGLRDKALDMGHARALLSIDKASVQLKLYNEILKNGLSVRQVEQLVKNYREGDKDGAVAAAGKAKTMSSKDYEVLRKHLSGSFGVPVKFTCDAHGKGKITFPFKDEAELNKIISIFDTLK
ncbi:MAG: ParB/RepB/Spo0J family partition protein [Bacteroidales bacterium]|uniref:ParB/RepB/Spo0J family partition protein n=1 Tax=Sodaliphilus sp. TaxID=2815818 RepID=UPI001B5E9652|nr:ParB/RepB/Spo0J family partition protein [Candidatus Sodaliphilus limicaballi]